jgi:hypothetical protein
VSKQRRRLGRDSASRPQAAIASTCPKIAARSSGDQHTAGCPEAFVPARAGAVLRRLRRFELARAAHGGHGRARFIGAIQK